MIGLRFRGIATKNYYVYLPGSSHKTFIMAVSVPRKSLVLDRFHHYFTLYSVAYWFLLVGKGLNVLGRQL